MRVLPRGFCELALRAGIGAGIGAGIDVCDIRSESGTNLVHRTNDVGRWVRMALFNRVAQRPNIEK